MKKCFFAAALSLLAVLPAAQADCTFDTITGEKVRSIIKEHGGWQVSDAQCAILTKKKLALVVDNHFTVLEGVSVAWASATLREPVLNINADVGHVSTYVNSKSASMDVAEALQYKAIEAAVKGLDFDKAAREIDAYRAKAAASFRQPAKR